MKAVYAVVVENGVKVRRPIILEDRRCEFCGRSYAPQRQSSRFCSGKCVAKADYARNSEKYKENSRKWHREYPEKSREYRLQQYWANPEHWRAKTREWNRLNPERKRAMDKAYKDRVRHDRKRAKLIEENGLVCSRCGKTGTSFGIVAHHVTNAPTDHSRQELLCRACHCKLHSPHIS
jgi:hypothetical protein